MIIDDKLIGAHQWIVDTTEKKPTWCAEQSAYLNALVTIASSVITWEDGWDLALLCLMMIIAALLVFSTKNEAVFKRFSEAHWVRGLFIAFTVINTFSLVQAPSGLGFLHLIGTVTMGMYYYFACCEAPRPKKRKEKVVLKAA